MVARQYGLRTVNMGVEAGKINIPDLFVSLATMVQFGCIGSTAVQGYGFLHGSRRANTNRHVTRRHYERVGYRFHSYRRCTTTILCANKDCLFCGEYPSGGMMAIVSLER